jgi:ubiquitin-like modifier-activating enzyme ATG7
MQNPFPQLLRYVNTLQTRIDLLQKIIEENNRVLEEYNQQQQQQQQHDQSSDQPSTSATTPATSKSPPTLKEIRFLPFSSRPEASFFRELAERKLGKYMLAESRVNIVGWYQVPLALSSNNDNQHQPRAWLEVRDTSFEPDISTTDNNNITGGGFPGQVRSRGYLINVNTLEKFKALDKAGLLREICDDLQNEMIASSSKRTSNHPNPNDSSFLSTFIMLTYADLKAHKYLYWFAFASVSFTAPILATRIPSTSNELAPLLKSIVQFWTSSNKNMESGFCCIFSSNTEHSSRVIVSSLGNYHSILSNFKGDLTVYFVCIDPSSLITSPGWPLRNLIAYVRLCLDFPVGSRVKFLSVRDANSVVLNSTSNTIFKSIVWEIEIPEIQQPTTITATTTTTAAIPTTGGVWEPNEQQKMSPRLVDLSSTLSPAKLSETASDLNVRLMKWRALPELNQDILKNTRVLLLGAGTLGCGVARSLLGWGFRHLTFCDQGKVSYSNPSRQSLFVVEDCINGGKPKAQRAAEAVREIHPGCQAEGWNLSIPMPGHYHGTTSSVEEDHVRNSCMKLNELIASHDVVCLLTDTRESRWLPTVLGAYHDKIVLNAALGFDSYLVMRHGGGGGISATTTTTSSSSNRLGCYFCSDVVAPINSTQDRTLDQQCTVTRPGAAPIASALLVELLVGILHHPKKQHAPLQGDGLIGEDHGRVIKLGTLPHQIRGHLPTYQNVLVHGQAFPQCTACSEKILTEYRNHGIEFILNALKEPSYLEKLTGLDKLLEQLNNNNHTHDDDDLLLGEEMIMEDDEFGRGES